MNIRLLSVVLIGSLVLGASRAQDDSDAVFELSPFTVEGGSYSAYKSSAPSVAFDERELGPSPEQIVDEFRRYLPAGKPGVPVALVKPADELSIRFALSFYDDLEKVREATLRRLLDQVQAKVEANGAFRFEPEALMIAKGDRTKSLRKRRAEYTSHAQFVLFAPIAQGQRPFETVEAARALIDGMKLEGEYTKLFDGPVALVLKRPDQYRAELLEAIFADLSTLKNGLGGEFEILPSGLNGAVRARPFSDTQVEVWIDYSFAIRSIRDLERKRED